MNISDIRRLEERYVWERDYRHAPIWQQGLMHTLRTVVLLIRDFFDGDLNLRAMSLVYTTLLSLVPLLAFAFAILKGFGVHNQLESTLQTYLAPLGSEKSVQIAESIIEFVNNMNVRVLGAIGLAVLIYSVVSLMQKVEVAFNNVWHVLAQRSFGQRFATFISALTVGPILILAAIAMTGTVLNTSFVAYLRGVTVLGSAIEFGLSFLPFVFIISAFTFLYAFIPNTRVRFSAAFVGGLVAGILWEMTSLAFGSFAAGASKYQAVYATFASAILFMIWLYLNWLILLVGARVAFYAQNPDVVALGPRKVHFTRSMIEKLALLLLVAIGRRMYEHGPPYRLDELSAKFQLPEYVVEHVLTMLQSIGILTRTDDEPFPGYLPNVPLDSTTVAELLESMEAEQPTGTYCPPLPSGDEVETIQATLVAARKKALQNLTLKDLALLPRSADKNPGEIELNRSRQSTP